MLDDGNQYLYGAGLEAMLTGSGTNYYLADGLGSTMAMVDSSGAVQKSYTYDVYGKPTATGALPNEFDFAGQQTDPTGLQYLRARYYDVETGTFLSREPLEATPGWTGNGFGYGAANPARMVDPTGRYLDDGGDGCGKGYCQDLNDLIPHADGTFFREYKGQNQFCAPERDWRGIPQLVCRNMSAEDFNLQATCTIEWGVDLIICTNQFGGVFAAGRAGPGDLAEIEMDALKSCGFGIVSGLVAGSTIGKVFGPPPLVRAAAQCLANAIGTVVVATTE